jgi:hypothetical protein
MVPSSGSKLFTAGSLLGLQLSYHTSYEEEATHKTAARRLKTNNPAVNSVLPKDGTMGCRNM